MNLKSLSDDELKQIKVDLESEIAKLNNGQMAKKSLMNTEYGALANRFFRYHDIRLAAAITLSGQLAIRWIEKYLMKHPAQEKYGYKVIYSDTDSLYICMDKIGVMLEKKCKGDVELILDNINKFSDKIIQPIIDEGYQKMADYVGAVENRMFMKQEKLSVSAFWTGKKKYACLVYDDEGVRYKEPKLKVTGIETVRASTPEMIKHDLQKVIKMVLTDYSNLDAFIEETKQKFFKSDPEKIAITMGVNTYDKYVECLVINPNDPTEYESIDEKSIFKYEDLRTSDVTYSYKKGTPIAVRAAMVHNQYVATNELYNSVPFIRAGEKIKYVFLRMPNPHHENVIGFMREMIDKERLMPFIDYRTQFYKTFLKPIENITKRLRIALRSEKTTNIVDIF